ncbi:HNH endonuclease [Chlamydiota bacterium]
MTSKFQCIYCLKKSPEVTPSRAHIFTDAIGGSTTTKDLVCSECNHKINKEIETPILDSLAHFQNIWGIKSMLREVWFIVVVISSVIVPRRPMLS